MANDVPEPLPLVAGTPLENEMRAVLMECALIISSYRNRNASAGFPLREPPGADRIITRVDSLVAPNTDEAGNLKRKSPLPKVSPPPPPPVALCKPGSDPFTHTLAYMQQQRA